MFCLNKFIIYKATSPSGKSYIGLTCQGLDKRKYDHYYSALKLKQDSKFYRALRKYPEQMIWNVLKTGLSCDLARKYEMYYIKKMNTYNNGYNSTFGGEKGEGMIFTPERILKMSAIGKQAFSTPESRQRMSETQKRLFSDPKYKKDHTLRMKRIHSTYDARLINSKKSGGKPFNCYNFITKQFVKTYEIIMDANNELCLPNGKISWCLMGKRNHTHSYIFKYTDDPTVVGIEYNIEWDKNIKRRPNANIRRKED